MPNSIAIGQNAYAAPTASSVSVSDAIAIGSNAKATGKNSIAIGGSASADDSIAIGGATSQKHQIVLGTKKDVVYIPGHLVVGGQTWLGVDQYADYPQQPHQQHGQRQRTVSCGAQN